MGLQKKNRKKSAKTEKFLGTCLNVQENQLANFAIFLNLSTHEFRQNRSSGSNRQTFCETVKLKLRSHFVRSKTQLRKKKKIQVHNRYRKFSLCYRLKVDCRLQKGGQIVGLESTKTFSLKDFNKIKYLFETQEAEERKNIS